MQHYFWRMCNVDRVDQDHIGYTLTEEYKYCTKCGTCVYSWSYGNLEFDDFRWSELWKKLRQLFSFRRSMNIEDIEF